MDTPAQQPAAQEQQGAQDQQVQQQQEQPVQQQQQQQQPDQNQQPQYLQQQQQADAAVADQPQQEQQADYDAAELQQHYLLQQQYDQQQQQQCWYQLDARGKIEAYDEDDWFVPESIPFKRRQNVGSTMAASRPHPWKRVRHHIAADNYHELPADTPTYVSLEAPPPLYPPKRYCDVTGVFVCG